VQPRSLVQASTDSRLRPNASKTCSFRAIVKFCLLPLRTRDQKYRLRSDEARIRDQTKTRAFRIAADPLRSANGIFLSEYTKGNGVGQVCQSADLRVAAFVRSCLIMASSAFSLDAESVQLTSAHRPRLNGFTYCMSAWRRSLSSCCMPVKYTSERRNGICRTCFGRLSGWR
jgi:hypothetical protein